MFLVGLSIIVLPQVPHGGGPITQEQPIKIPFPQATVILVEILGCENLPVWLQIPVLPLNLVILGKLLHFSVLQFLRFQNGDDDRFFDVDEIT